MAMSDIGLHTVDNQRFDMILITLKQYGFLTIPRGTDRSMNANSGEPSFVLKMRYCKELHGGTIMSDK